VKSERKSTANQRFIWLIGRITRNILDELKCKRNAKEKRLILALDEVTTCGRRCSHDPECQRGEEEAGIALVRCPRSMLLRMDSYANEEC